MKTRNEVQHNYTRDPAIENPNFVTLGPLSPIAPIPPTIVKRSGAHFGEGVTVEEMPQYTRVRPELQVSVAFNDWTNARALRHAGLVRFLDK